ncbi:glycosyltransferase family 4 protein [Arcticibacter eurypsychrophilus]|uniref:glycosyltransferase family 4 protein n=1 Tax=Arcticibacter eurypsychrophilus TaxID=1434752 RepID=UPI00084DC43D|nr:glycosyltransferase family 4 protein [Arcticibacter eurypsychrophilus]
MTKVGIYCPSWILGFYNTDQRVVQSFARIQDFTDLETNFIANSGYTLSFNINRVVERITGKSISMYHGLKNSKQDNDVIYLYGAPLSKDIFFKSVGATPVFVTAGFMTDHYVKDLFGVLTDRQKEADDLARRVDKASLIHFHTEGGRQRFLSYRPEFEKKTVAIPFFLPGISLPNSRVENNESNKKGIHVLFIGREGKRKGLHELVEALDSLGSDFLKLHQVCVTIVSKDKPQPKSDIHITWHAELPHREVIQLMQEASIFVLVPRQESYGLVLIEAMMCKCAIITDDDETRKEILDNTAIYVPFGSSKHIANALLRLIEDNIYMMHLGEMAKKRAERLFHPNIVATQYEKCFQSIAVYANSI